MNVKKTDKLVVFRKNEFVHIFASTLSVLFIISFCNCFLAINYCNGQSLKTTKDSNNINLVQDKRIGQLIEKHISINQGEKGKKGYRVQIFFGSSKKQAMEIKALFIEAHPDQESYVVYDVPYFKVRTGNFRTRIEAVKLQSEIGEEFPGCFIVQDRIPIQEMEEEY